MLYSGGIMSKLRVLLAEDSTIVLEIEKKCLQESGVSIFTASRAEDVLKVARKVKPGLIYLAFGISSGAGESCCRALKADADLRTIPVVMVCAADGERQRSREAGCDGVIAKPIDRREFLESCRSLSAEADDDERMPCRAFVQYTQGNESFFGTVEDVSMDGMFIGTSREVKAGELLTLKFLLPWSGATLIKTSGQVSWVNNRRHRRNKSLPPGFGVNFQGIDPHAADQIDDYLQLMRKRLEE
jgi:DNA-binding response OmpR family regulator